MGNITKLRRGKVITYSWDSPYEANPNKSYQVFCLAKPKRCWQRLLTKKILSGFRRSFSILAFGNADNLNTENRIPMYLSPVKVLAKTSFFLFHTIFLLFIFLPCFKSTQINPLSFNYLSKFAVGRNIYCCGVDQETSQFNLMYSALE